MNGSPNQAHRSLRRHAVAGGAVLALLIGGLGGWAVTTELSGAVLAPGIVVVDTNVKKVQHPTGGIVGELRARDSVRVRAGDVLVRLDETVTRANLSIIVKSIDELSARTARLEAERDEAADMMFPAALRGREGDVELGRVMSGERKLFELRSLARNGQKAQLRERIAQLREEVRSLTDQAAVKRREVQLIGRELEGVRHLWSKNLIQISRLIALEREELRLEGEHAQYLASAAQARGRITETELQTIQIDQDLRSEVARELREIQGKMAELVERQVAAEDQLKRIELRAPIDGVIHQLAAHTVGGVISPGEVVMLIVPEADDLTIECRISPQDIDQLKIGQGATVRLAAFDQSMTPEIEGTVTRISADITEDARSGVAFYVARIAISARELERAGRPRLVPGMPVEAFVRTNDRTVMSYLMKPLRDQVVRAFRER